MTDLSKMNLLINELANAPFEFGKVDCYAFTARMVKEFHGKDYVENHAVYKNEQEALDYMEASGGIEALTTDTLGYPIDPVACRDGDVVTAEVGTGIALGFVYNNRAMFKSKKKVLNLPLEKCRKGWRIS